MGKTKVLIIDDNIDDQELFTRSLGKSDYDIFYAMDSIEGFSFIKNQRPDIVLLDYSLPGNDGLHTLKKIRNYDISIPIIILTGHGSEAIAVRSLKEGACDYIKKSSVTKESLIEVISLTIKKKQQEFSQLSKQINSTYIMIVDDNIDDQERCVRALKKVEGKNYRYVCVADGKKMFDAIMEKIPDVILLDYSLPGHNGVDLIKKVHEQNQHISIIMMTGQGNEAIAVKALKAGACDYIIKGDITPELLDKSITAAIEHNMLEKQIYEKDIKIQIQQRELAESQQFLNLMMENNPDFICVKDKDLKIVQANTAFKNAYPEKMQDKIIGYKTGKNYNKVETESFLAMDKKAFQEGYSEIFENIILPNGISHTLFTQRIRFENNQGEPFILVISRDITEKEKLINDLTNSNEDLERFAYIASHDLQEPLRMVVNFTQLLEKEYGENLDEQAKEYLQFSSNAAIRMQLLVNDLLEYSRVGQEAEKLVKVDFMELLNDVKLQLSDSIKQYEAEIKCDYLPTVKANPIRLTRLVQNIIDNAMKYTRADKKPIIHISSQDQNDYWLISIKDNGIGMKKEYFEKIFVPFKRLHSHFEYKGSGIGLSVCKKIVENLGGEIWVESEIGKGSQFLFTIPKEHKLEDKVI